MQQGMVDGTNGHQREGRDPVVIGTSWDDVTTGKPTLRSRFRSTRVTVAAGSPATAKSQRKIETYIRYGVTEYDHRGPQIHGFHGFNHPGSLFGLAPW